MTENIVPPTPADWCAYRAALRTRKQNANFVLRPSGQASEALKADARAMRDEGEE